MQERRYRPGDVLDDYCPRERRITDHAIVAMIDDEIRRTRCGVCDAEHEYKQARVPAPRRKTQPPALFNQVLEGISGPSRPQSVPEPASGEPPMLSASAETAAAAADLVAPVEPVKPVESTLARGNADELRRDAPGETSESGESAEPEESGFRRSLIRATFPRPDGQPPPARDIPEFTIHSLHNRRNGQRHAGGQSKFRGGRRRAGGGTLDHLGPMRFRDHGHGQSNGPGHGGGGRRRRGKKNR